MIIGKGLIAKSLQDIDSDSILFFASGVSNSLETKSSEFEREITLLKKNLEQYKEKKIVYFSTLSIHDQSKQNSHYILHKLKIENYIRNSTQNYLILRIGNIVGKGGNPNTLFNYLKSQISNHSRFILHTNARRLFIDVDDLAEFIKINVEHLDNKIINMAFPYYFKIKEVVHAIEDKITIKANFQEINEGDFYKIHFNEEVQDYFSDINSDDYLKTLTRKYI